MTVEIISQSISMKVWDWAWIKLATPGSAVGLVSFCLLIFFNITFLRIYFQELHQCRTAYV